MNRRTFLSAAAAGPLACVAPPQHTSVNVGAVRPRVILFDAFPVFDPRALAALAKRRFGEQGEPLMDVWRTHMFQYQWLRALGGRYADFSAIAADALSHALRRLRLESEHASRDELLELLGRLPAWPDAPEALERLRSAGHVLAFLSNMTEQLIRSNLESTGLGPMFHRVISTDSRQSYKPDPRAYQLGTEHYRLRKEEMLFVAFASWDACGAKWFGYPTFWMNRLNSAADELGATPDGEGKSFLQLEAYLGR